MAPPCAFTYNRHGRLRQRQKKTQTHLVRANKNCTTTAESAARHPSSLFSALAPRSAQRPDPIAAADPGAPNAALIITRSFVDELRSEIKRSPCPFRWVRPSVPTELCGVRKTLVRVKCCVGVSHCPAGGATSPSAVSTKKKVEEEVEELLPLLLLLIFFPFLIFASCLLDSRQNNNSNARGDIV